MYSWGHKSDKPKHKYKHHIERRVIHGQIVDVKVYEPLPEPETTHKSRWSYKDLGYVKDKI